jgi:hypothetical protein
VELSSVGLSQYPSAQIASSNLERLRQGLATCPGETVEGEEVTYAVMSTPKMEHPTLGIRVSAENYTVLLNIAQVGPTVAYSGAGGVTTADADLAAQLLEQQVDATSTPPGSRVGRLRPWSRLRSQRSAPRHESAARTRR